MLTSNSINERIILCFLTIIGCSLLSMSMFTVELMPRNFPRSVAIYMKDMIVAGILEELGIVSEYLYLIRAETLPYILFGQDLSPQTPQNYLSGMLSALSLDYSESLKFVESNLYVNLNQTCGVIHSSLIASLMNSDRTLSADTQHWGGGVEPALNL